MFRILRRCLVGLVVAVPLLLAAPNFAQAQWYSSYSYPGGYTTYYRGSPYYYYYGNPRSYSYFYPYSSYSYYYPPLYGQAPVNPPYWAFRAPYGGFYYY